MAEKEMCISDTSCIMVGDRRFEDPRGEKRLEREASKFSQSQSVSQSS